MGKDKELQVQKEKDYKEEPSDKVLGIDAVEATNVVRKREEEVRKNIKEAKAEQIRKNGKF